MTECGMPPLRSIQPPLANAPTIHQSNLNGLNNNNSGGAQKNFDMKLLDDIAKARWLNASELCFLLDMKYAPLSITRHPPETSPPSGTLILYNRSFTRNYKEDHYSWIKKRNSTKVREDHVKLRLGGKYRVAGCYVHCVTIASMHRRAYHLLHTNEDGSAPTPPAGNGMLKSPTSLVLVHYLDTQVASVFASTLDDFRNMSLMNFIPDEFKVQSRKPGSGRKSKKFLTIGNKETLSAKTVRRDEASSPALKQEGIDASEKSGSPDKDLLPSEPPQDVGTASSPSPSVAVNDDLNADETTYDDEALDILWSMVMEEGSDNVMQVLDNDAVGAMLESHASFGAMLEMDGTERSKKQDGHGRSMSEEFMGMLNADDEFDDEKEDDKLGSSVNFSKAASTSSGGKKFSGRSSPSTSDHSYETNNQKVSFQDQDYQHQVKNASKPEQPSKEDQLSESRQYYEQQHHQNFRHDNYPASNYQHHKNMSSPHDQMHNNQYYNYDATNRWNNYPNKQNPKNSHEQHAGYRYSPQHHAPGINNYHYQAYVQSYNPNSSSANGSEPLHIPQERPKSASPPPMVIPTSSKQTPLPDIVDFTPEHGIIQNHSTISSITSTKSTKVALSFSAPLPKKPDDGKSSTWHRIAVFAEIQITEEQKLVIGDMDLSSVTVLNPYSYRCNVPASASKPGNRKIFITEVKLYKGIDPICEGILQFITDALQVAWDNAVSNQISKKKNPIKLNFSKKDESSNIRVLTQLSVSSFELEAPMNHVSTTQQQQQPQCHHQQQHQHQGLKLQQKQQQHKGLKLQQKQQQQQQIEHHQLQIAQKQQQVEHHQQQIIQAQQQMEHYHEQIVHKQLKQQEVVDANYISDGLIKQLHMQQQQLAIPKYTPPSDAKNSCNGENYEKSIVSHTPITTTVEPSRKRNSIIYNAAKEEIINDDRHNKVRFVESNKSIVEVNQQDASNNYSQSGIEPQSPNQPKLIQLLHVAQMDQSEKSQQQQELTYR